MPRERVTTAGRRALAATQSSAATVLEMVPLPEQSRMRTATTLAPLATPTCRPATVADTCVPWPSQSSAVSSSSTKSKPAGKKKEIPAAAGMIWKTTHGLAGDEETERPGGGGKQQLG
jgi:hypothetical protein